MMLMLHAVEDDHHFVELFTTKEKLDAYLAKRPTVKKKEVTEHAVDPE